MRHYAVGFTLFLFLWLGMVAGCARNDETDQWLSTVQQAHETADGAAARNDLDTARKALDDAVRATVPKEIGPEDARGVRQDLFCRLALIELRARHPERAREWADQGLLLGDRADVFGANLHIARGRAYEALGQDVAAGRDYHTALTISEALLERALGTEDHP